MRRQMYRRESRVLYELIFVAFDFVTNINARPLIDSYSHYAHITLHKR